MKNSIKYLWLGLLVICNTSKIKSQEINRPNIFQEVSEVIPSIILEIRYFSTNNFIGVKIDGYKKAKAYLTKPAIEKLKKAAEEFEEKGMRIKIFDAYRPQRAVNHFVRWANDKDDVLMKSEYYPDVSKKDLFRLDYIASKSGHSRGSTLDLTLVNLKTGKELDMGSSYDFFGKISWPFAKNITKKQKENRMLLREVMLNNSFVPYKCEWWHFTLKNEPFPNTYFDFLIE